MKKLWVALLIFLLLLPHACAEVKAYTLDHDHVNNVWWINENEFITFGQDDSLITNSITWWKDGRVFRELTYTYGSSLDHLRNLSFLRLAGGAFKGVVPVVLNTQPWDVRNYTVDWTEQGLVNALEVPMAQAVGSCLLSEDRPGSGRRVLTVMDADGKLKFRREYAVNDTYDDLPWVQLGENTFALQYMSMQDPIGDRLLLVIGEQGELLRRQLGLEASVFGDGKGGWFVYARQSRQSYDDGLLSHYDAHGRETARRTLRGGKTVRHLRSAVYRAETDSYLICGSAVANSRKVYDVFLLETDDALSVCSVDVRALPEEYGDYEPAVSFTPGGAPYAFIRDLGGSFRKPALLTPFQALPKASDPGIRLE